MKKPILLKILFFVLLALLLVASAIVYKKREQLSLRWALLFSPPTWATEQIAQDFSLFQATGINQDALDATYQKIIDQQIPVYRYRILDGNIYRKPEKDHAGRAAVYDKMLKRLQRSISLPAMDFLLCVMDGVPEVYVPSRFWIAEKQAPLLCWAKKKDAPALVLVPDFLTTRESGWHREIDTVNEKYLSVPWEKRKEKAFWRGTASDKNYTLDNYSTKPRFQISLLSTQHANFVDAGFCKAPPNISQTLADLNLLVGHTPVAGHLDYKYLPVLDGWMCTFPGFQWRLLSGSLSLKQESDEIQYFYSALQPSKHYILIKNDMSDLLEKITWAIDHDHESRTIAENARSFALQNLMPNHIYSYLYWVLKQYASLQSFEHFEMDASWKKI